MSSKKSPYNQNFVLWRTRPGKPVLAYCNTQTILQYCDRQATFPACEFTTAKEMDYESHKDCVKNIAKYIADNNGFRPGDYLTFGTGKVVWGAACLTQGFAPNEFTRIPIEGNQDKLELVVLPSQPPDSNSLWENVERK